MGRRLGVTAPAGWICSRCGASVAPHVTRCTCASPDPKVHYGVLYQAHPDRPKQIAAELMCASYVLGASSFLVTRDWNTVTCRRCMNSRAKRLAPHPNRVPTAKIIEAAPQGLVFGSPDHEPPYWKLWHQPEEGTKRARSD